MFSFENGPDIETVPNASEFLGDTLNIWDNDRAMIYYLKKDGCFSMALLWGHRQKFRVKALPL
jgi:hypothetical protein